MVTSFPNVNIIAFRRGEDLGGDGGRSLPKNLRWGDGPCIRSPNILRSSVVGLARKHEQSKKIGIVKEFFSGIVFFLVKKGSYTTFYTVKIRGILKKRINIRKTWWLKKKGHQKFWAWKWAFFSEKKSFRNFRPRKFFPSPQTRRQVSATGFSYLSFRIWNKFWRRTLFFET